MTLTDLLPSLPVTYEFGIQHALIFDAELKQRLVELQASHQAQHVASPVLLSDGRYLLTADVLTEVGPGGLYGDVFTQMPLEYFNAVEVVPLADVRDLLLTETE